MGRKQKNGRRCRFESLENRRMMTGNVKTDITAGSLFVKGDNFDNSVEITAGPNPFEVLVIGHTVGGNPTMINGVPNGTTTIRGVTRSVKVDLRLGNNELDVHDVDIFGTGTFKSGSGVDFFDVVDTNIDANLKVRQGAGHNELAVVTTNVFGKAIIVGGRDRDIVSLTGDTALGTVYGALKVSLKKGNDALSVTNINVIKKTTIKGGKGINLFTKVGTNFFGGYFNKSNFAGA